MRVNLEDEDILRHYLLGLLKDMEQQQVEERLLVDDDYFSSLQIVENELIDEYVRGRLTISDREKFENYFMIAPERKQRVRFARALQRKAADSVLAVENTQAEPRRTSLYTLFHFRNLIKALAFALILLAIGAGLWLAFRNKRTSTEIAHTQEPGEATTSGQPAAKPETKPQTTPTIQPEPTLISEQGKSQRMAQKNSANRSDSRSTVTLILTPGLARDTGETRKLVLSAGLNLVRLRLDLIDDNYHSYRAELETVEGAKVLSRGPLKAQRAGSERALFLSVPARSLANADYIIKLSGITGTGGTESIGSYYFRISR